jgi:hypothetical protein
MRHVLLRVNFMYQVGFDPNKTPPLGTMQLSKAPSMLKNVYISQEVQILDPI